MDHKKCCAPACGVEATLICSGCRSVRYCSKDHQKSHWGEHKLSCKPYKEVGEIQTGKHLVASRNLEPGDIILQEAPLLLWLLMTDANQPKTVCVGCCGYLDESTGMKKCLQCKWPECKEENCWAEASPHALGECALLKSALRSRVTVNATQSTSNSEERGDELYYSILIFRCLELRDRDMVKWKKLMELKDFQSSSIDIEGPFSLDVDAIVELVKRMLATSNKPFEEELIRKLCRLFYVQHKFSLQPIPNHRSEDLKAVYHVGSMIEHGCVANCTRTFTKDGQIVVRAAVPIKIRTKISLNYTPEPYWNTWTRQLFLSRSRFFDCPCELCKDPTEFGTFVNGIYCPNCSDRQGIFLPENPLDDRCDWVCNKCSERSIFREGFVFESQCKAIEAYYCLNRQSVEDYEGFIRKFAGILHPHHSYMTKVKLALCRMYGQSKDDEVLNKKEPLAREMLKIADVVTPGLSHERATLLNFIYSTLMIKIENLRKAGGCDNIFSAIEIARLDMRQGIMDELLLILSFEPEESHDGQIFKYISTFEF